MKKKKSLDQLESNYRIGSTRSVCRHRHDHDRIQHIVDGGYVFHSLTSSSSSSWVGRSVNDDDDDDDDATVVQCEISSLRAIDRRSIVNNKKNGQTGYPHVERNVANQQQHHHHHWSVKQKRCKKSRLFMHLTIRPSTSRNR